MPIRKRQSHAFFFFLFWFLLAISPSFADVCCTPQTCPAGQMCATSQACASAGGASGGACGLSGATFCCTPAPTAVCGNGTRERNEECDDGNTLPGDGCDANCEAEPCPRGTCMDAMACSGNQGIGTQGCGFNLSMTCCVIPVCGDGIREGGEECDNGNSNSDNGTCTKSCRNNICGDGLLYSGVEECDRGMLNGTPDSGCTSSCQIQICGNSIVEPGEQCDNGVANGTPQNNCSSTCQSVSACSSGYSCNVVLDCALIGQNTDCIQNTNCTTCCRCVPPPGCNNDGIVDPDEQCDGPNSCPNNGICDSECLCQDAPPSGCNNNGIVDAGEECDGPGTCSNGSSCSNCICEAPPPPPVMCNGLSLDPGEECDGAANPCPNPDDICNACVCTPGGGAQPAPEVVIGAGGAGNCAETGAPCTFN